MTDDQMADESKKHAEAFTGKLDKYSEAENRVRFQSLMLDAVGQAVIATDLDGVIIYANRAAEAQYGWPAGDLKGRNIVDATVPRTLRSQAEEIMSQLVRGKRWSGEFVVQRRDGAEFMAHVTNAPVMDEQGNLKAIIGVSTDVSEIKRTENALRESEERYRIVSEMVSDYAYSFRVEPDGRFIGEWVTDAFERLTGYQPKELPSTDDWAKLYHPGDIPIIQRHVQAILAGKDDIRDFRFIAKDGRTLWVRSYNRPIWSEAEGRVVRVYGAVQDISVQKDAEMKLHDYSHSLEEIIEERTQELKDAQAELLVKERLAVLGHFAGSISHELRNPLGAIDASAYLLNMKFGGIDDKLKEHVDRIQSNVAKSTAIIESLLNLSRMEKPKTQRIDLTEFFTDALPGFKIPETVETALDLPDRPVFAAIDPEQILMALKNIIQNSVQAMDWSGALTIAARPSAAGDVEISVVDTGSGISPEHVERVFEPLFSTKTHGIGFGLSIVRMIVENHGGTIRAESESGNGAVFTILLPFAG